MWIHVQKSVWKLIILWYKNEAKHFDLKKRRNIDISYMRIQDIFWINCDEIFFDSLIKIERNESTLYKNFRYL